ncbi:MAG: hydrogenase 4 membrane component (E)-like protein [Desulfurella sp.]|jgi:hydrogenase-4 component E|uniref:Hydrogenase-4 component E n=1 Tax=Desulfurella multipotens TaxID=79269 RepID=A0A1G6QKE1_9BACT|nr:MULTISPECIES: hydrogenase 4 membrane component (E)-like protein [Desulfurella]PMP69297.1 MAG: hydrogenase 4 membrane component (E)-like protein [Desulfurella multipotens]PMP88776.1 MAG: hydrogenase 4 membrane component (E)-like protein [Desulfurella sp.]SDC92900.1 hydrogenase-4 component E [Desulfurella multipotens]HEX12993.1 hydrogenase 4 membrane component (E)-like protein [Desulfurella acetivorans]
MQHNVFILIGFIEIALSIFMQWQNYVSNNIKTFSIQSWILGIFLMYFGVLNNNISIIILSILTILTRAIFIPRYLINTINKQIFRARENKHKVSVSLSILISVLLAIFSYILYTVVFFEFGKSLISIPITLMLQGAFLIMSRSNAYAQLIGYLVMENSMFLLSFLFNGLPFIVEAGIILDILGIVMIGGILMKIRDEDIQKEEELYG